MTASLPKTSRAVYAMVGPSTDADLTDEDVVDFIDEELDDIKIGTYDDKGRRRRCAALPGPRPTRASGELSSHRDHGAGRAGFVALVATRGSGAISGAVDQIFKSLAALSAPLKPAEQQRSLDRDGGGSRLRAPFRSGIGVSERLVGGFIQFSEKFEPLLEQLDPVRNIVLGCEFGGKPPREPRQARRRPADRCVDLDQSHPRGVHRERERVDLAATAQRGSIDLMREVGISLPTCPPARGVASRREAALRRARAHRPATRPASRSGAPATTAKPDATGSDRRATTSSAASPERRRSASHPPVHEARTRRRAA